MTTVGAYEAKTHLPELLDRVSKGESITITKRGKPVAILVPPPDDARADPQTIAQELIALRRQLGPQLDGLKITNLIREGRKR